MKTRLAMRSIRKIYPEAKTISAKYNGETYRMVVQNGKFLAGIKNGNVDMSLLPEINNF